MRITTGSTGFEFAASFKQLRASISNRQFVSQSDPVVVPADAEGLTGTVVHVSEISGVLPAVPQTSYSRDYEPGCIQAVGSSYSVKY